MLFWHVALLFSGLCTSVLATGFGGYPSHPDASQSSGAIGNGGYDSDASQSSGAIGHDGYHSGASQSSGVTGHDGSRPGTPLNVHSGTYKSSAGGVPHGYEELQGCWIGTSTKNHPDRKNVGKKLSIEGRKIVHSTLSEQIKMDPQVLDDTYWKQSEECEGLPKRTTIAKHRIRIIGWRSDHYSVSFSDAANGFKWRPAESLWLGGIFKKNKKSAAAVE